MKPAFALKEIDEIRLGQFLIIKNDHVVVDGIHHTGGKTVALFTRCNQFRSKEDQPEGEHEVEPLYRKTEVDLAHDWVFLVP